MQVNDHIGEAAELYAAGQLDAAEIAAIEAHAAGCEACLRRLGEVEETVLALERVNKPLAPPAATNVLPFARRQISPWWLVPAMAAALFVGFLWPRAQSSHDAATLALVNGHFSHAQFAGAGPKAKVLYARDRSWYYVIVAEAGRYDVYGVAGDNRVSLGSTNAAGSTSELFVKMRERFDHLELRGGSGAMETATIR
ncbi:MAG TPA: zf-HC2 domain-containing protein [Candidatus Baltobacteraceae bacterium]|jgi:anti-sigma factor RsiW|nr:zf-HC2 domain-containing protein [Candidatus Baltobacteraceae bacterium]